MKLEDLGRFVLDLLGLGGIRGPKHVVGAEVGSMISMRFNDGDLLWGRVSESDNETGVTKFTAQDGDTYEIRIKDGEITPVSGWDDKS